MERLKTALVWLGVIASSEERSMPPKERLWRIGLPGGLVGALSGLIATSVIGRRGWLIGLAAAVVLVVAGGLLTVLRERRRSGPPTAVGPNEGRQMGRLDKRRCSLLRPTCVHRVDSRGRSIFLVALPLAWLGWRLRQKAPCCGFSISQALPVGNGLPKEKQEVPACHQRPQGSSSGVAI